MPSPSPCQIIRLGTVEYHRAWELQVEMATKVRDGAQPQRVTQALEQVNERHGRTLKRLAE